MDWLKLFTDITMGFAGFAIVGLFLALLFPYNAPLVFGCAAIVGIITVFICHRYDY